LRDAASELRSLPLISSALRVSEAPIFSPMLDAGRHVIHPRSPRSEAA
jgi:hypothetical protein